MNIIWFPLLFITTWSMASVAEQTEGGVQYRLALAEDGKTYQVWLKPDTTPKPDISLTGQVTIKAPHQANFVVSNLQSAVASSDWSQDSRVSAPEENREYDYISFSYVSTKNSSALEYHLQAGQEKMIFSFENKNGCINGVSLMDNNDPFNTQRNSANTNPGNHFTNIGLGAIDINNYKGNYGNPISCP